MTSMPYRSATLPDRIARVCSAVSCAVCSASMPCTVDGKTYYRDTGSLGPGLAIIGTFALLGGGALIAIPGHKEQSDLFMIRYKL